MTRGAGGERLRVVVVRAGEHGLPYSKGLTTNSVMACGLEASRAYRVAEVIEDRLRALGAAEVEAGELRRITVDAIRDEAGDRYAEAYRKWATTVELDVPIVVLIGGATGVGKSTIATQLAARLGIARVISTDAIREVLKSVVAREFAPTLHVSSFAAADSASVKTGRSDDAVIAGFREQVSAVSVGVRALIQRAVAEGQDMILEGAHLVPGFLDLAAFGGEAVIVPLVLHVEDEGVHRSHFHVRAHETRARPIERYLAHFGNIRKIQKYIKSLALQNGVPIIPNYNLDVCIASVVDLIVDRAVEVATGRPPGPKGPVRAIRGGSR